MHVRNHILSFVYSYMQAARAEYAPEITDDMLAENGMIHYMNGNDGTDFDWKMNDRLCEFFLFYKDNDMGFIKVCVCKDGTVYGFLYKGASRDDLYKPYAYLPELKYYFNPSTVYALKRKLQKEEETFNKYDKPIDDFGFISSNQQLIPADESDYIKMVMQKQEGFEPYVDPSRY